MSLTYIDWLVIGAYLLGNLLIGVYYRARSSGSTEEFFISGRDVSWWLAGTSMVATTFAADTPLFVSGLVARHGIAGNWLWWALCLSSMMTVFFFARYWRRAEILTDVQLSEVRYGGPPAAFLRGFRAVYLGMFMNCLILGWVTKAMVDIITVVMGVPERTALLICIFILVPFTGIYTFIGGLWGVLVTDLFQFVLKMTMIIVLAWAAVSKLGGMHALESQLATIARNTREQGTSTGSLLSFVPSLDLHNWSSDALWTLPLICFFTYLAVQWWADWYPGAEPGGGGYVAQRMFSAKNEKHSLGATLWFNVAHYALRPWPWIITGLVALAVYSTNGGLHPSAQFAAQPEQGYVMVLRDFLPPALRGLMIAAFLAAFMSTVGTQLNWGTSYLINDLYRRFLVRQAAERHYVFVSKVVIVMLVLLSGLAAAQMTSIASAWHVLLETGAGTGAVYLLRWYWWRVNAWSEISAMAVAFATSLGLHTIDFAGSDMVVSAKRFLITTALTTVVWLAITFATKPETDDTLLAFYRRIQPSAYGWQRIADLAPEIPQVRDLGGNTFDWVMGCVLVYGALFGIGKLVLMQWVSGIVLLLVAAVAGYLIYWDLSRRGWDAFSGRRLEEAPAARNP